MLELKVKSRTFKIVGDRRDRVRSSIELSGETLYLFESAPYAMSVEDVHKKIKDSLDVLRLSLAKSGLQTKVIREGV